MDGDAFEIIVIIITVLVGLLQPLISKLLKKRGLNVPEENDDETVTDDDAGGASVRQATDVPSQAERMQQAAGMPSQVMLEHRVAGDHSGEADAGQVTIGPSRAANMWRTTADPPQAVTGQQAMSKAWQAGNGYSIAPARKREPLDKRKLIIYSEIMKPKFDDF